MVAYKKVDLAIEAFNKLKLPLIIVGDGPEAEKLKKKSNDNIKFLGRLSDGEIRDYYSKCTAFIFPEKRILE